MRKFYNHREVKNVGYGVESIANDLGYVVEKLDNTINGARPRF